MELSNSDFYDEAALRDRLTQGLKSGNLPVRFLVGSALTASADPASPGVLNVREVVDLIKNSFSGPALVELEAELASADNHYQVAFQFLVGRRGQQAANEIIKRAVWAARKKPYSATQQTTYAPGREVSDEACRELDGDLDGWNVPPGATALAQLVTNHPDRFGQHVLTTNFDPLIGVAIKQAGGQFIRTAVHRDGDLGQTSGEGCHIIHCHGYWYGADTLHTPRQLTQPRPRLKSSLTHILGRDLLVVIGYGGWDDVITQTIMDVVLDDRACPEVIWTFYDQNPCVPEALLQKLRPGIERGRVTLYRGIDCHKLLPELAAVWLEDAASPQAVQLPVKINKAPSNTLETRIVPPQVHKPSGKLFFDNNDKDSPPDIQFYVGRDREDKILSDADAPIIVLTGGGGQGKSAIAAKLFDSDAAKAKFRYRIWRDCREESERFERQLAILISAMSRGQVSDSELASQPAGNLVELFCALLGDDAFLFVFDNVDHYVDLEKNEITGPPRALIDRIGKLHTKSQFVFTCRPHVKATGSGHKVERITGLSIASARQLFSHRGAVVEDSELAHAHTVTEGNALWLDLLAAQLAKRSLDVRLEDMLAPVPPSGRPDVSASTLHAIWNYLKEDERLVLRALAETVRPSTEIEMASILLGKVRFNRIQRSVNSLKLQSLVVLKQGDSFQRIVELHPLLRTFIRRRFSKSERMTFIEAIIKTYLPFINTKPSTGTSVVSADRLQKWLDISQLYVESGKLENAIQRLSDISSIIRNSNAPGEYARIVHRLFEELDWDDFTSLEGADQVFEANLAITARFGRIDECNSLLERYLGTIDGKNARYIHYCDMNCFLFWVNEDFSSAILWGEEGARLKSESGVDTEYDTSHHLALAKRDGGLVDQALGYFLLGSKLEEVVDPANIDQSRDGAFYGNIGRCLHLMGQIEPALSCYKKSGALIESKPDGERVCNQAYVRQWVGELMVTRNDERLGEAFLRAALSKWQIVSPPKARSLLRSLDALEGKSADWSSDDCESEFVRWATAPS